MPQSAPIVVHEDNLEVEFWDDRALGQLSWRTLLSADRVPSHSITMGVATLEPGEQNDIGLHSHAQPEAYYVLSGTGAVTINEIHHEVRSGSAVFVPSGATHACLNTGDEPLRLLFVFPIDSFEEVEYDFNV